MIKRIFLIMLAYLLLTGTFYYYPVTKDLAKIKDDYTDTNIKKLCSSRPYSPCIRSDYSNRFSDFQFETIFFILKLHAKVLQADKDSIKNKKKADIFEAIEIARQKQDIDHYLENIFSNKSSLRDFILPFNFVRILLEKVFKNVSHKVTKDLLSKAEIICQENQNQCTTQDAKNITEFISKLK